MIRIKGMMVPRSHVSDNTMVPTAESTSLSFLIQERLALLTLTGLLSVEKSV